MNDPVNHPSHYCLGGIEVLDAIEAWKLPYHLGNVVKYIARAGKKNADTYLEDLKKARFYLDRYITRSEKEQVSDGDAGTALLQPRGLQAADQ